jgi:hypothetical protein
MFVLRIPVTLSAIELIKSYLSKSLPEVKSSHRVEAIGRGLGFRTYAALLVAAQSPVPPIALVSGAIFSDYLKRHGFEAAPAHLYLGSAHAAIIGVLDSLPRLHIHGIGFGQPQRNADGSRQTLEQQYAEFIERREECRDRHAAEAFLRSLALLTRVTATKTVRSGTGSYRLKHVAENYVCEYPEGEKLGPDYVPNGMLIAAALHMGFKYKAHVDHLGYDTQTLTFNMSKAVIDDLDAEIRPQTGFARGRAQKRQLTDARKQFAAMRRTSSLLRLPRMTSPRLGERC